MAKVITVKATHPGRVAVWDRHPDHPGGEIFVYSDEPVKAAMTPAVMLALSEGRIVEAAPAAAAEQPVEANSQRQNRRKE